MLAAVFMTVLVLTVTGTVYGVVLQVFQPLLRNRITHRTVYGFYKLGFLFFLIPFGALMGNLGKWLGTVILPHFTDTDFYEGMKPAAIEAGGSLINSYPVLNMNEDKKSMLVFLIPFVWLTGALALSAVRLIFHGIYLKRLRSTSLPVTEGRTFEIFKACEKELGLSDKIHIRVWSNDKVSIPFGSGFFKYQLWIPETDHTDSELRFIFLHELCHIMNGDAAVKYGALAANAIHWYNPFVYYYIKRMNLYCELACDEEVMKHIQGEEIRDYGMLLINMPKGKDMAYISFCPHYSDIKIRLHSIAKPVSVNQSSLVHILSICACIFCFMAGISFIGQQAAGLWKELFVYGEGNISAYKNYLNAENQIYEPYGLIYDKDSSTFYYKGKRVKVFLDERIMSQKEREIYPWVNKAWQCIHVDSGTDSQIYLKTVRNSDNHIIEILDLEPEAAESVIDDSYENVTYQSMYTDPGRLYASDRFEQGIPKQAIALGENIARHNGGYIKQSGKGETSGYIYYNGGQYPWKIVIKEDGIMEVMLYTLEGCQEKKPTIIQFASTQKIKEVVLYLDEKEVPLKNYT